MAEVAQARGEIGANERATVSAAQANEIETNG